MQNIIIIGDDIKQDFKKEKMIPIGIIFFIVQKKLIKHILPSHASHDHRSTSVESQKEQENILEIHF